VTGNVGNENYKNAKINIIKTNSLSDKKRIIHEIIMGTIYLMTQYKLKYVFVYNSNVITSLLNERLI
jgi:hypothetical protein